jgi:hypothetical protein
MNHISKYSEWKNISEATLDDTKIDVDYIPSRTGRRILDRLGITENLKLVQTSSIPKETELIMYIRPSSIKLIEFGDFIRINNIDISDIHSQVFIYDTTSTNVPFAVAMRGKTTMIKQANRVGASARGNYFRETAFIITFAIRLWEDKAVKIDIYSNRGKIKLDFKSNSNENENGRKATMSNSERAEFRNEYKTFMSNTRVKNSMIEQIDKLIIKLGNSIYNINYVVKNSTDLLINRIAQDYLKGEEDLFSEISSTSDIKNIGLFNVPQGVTMPKWNPSDIWIMYKGSDWILSNDKKSSLQKKDSYELRNIDDLESLNVFLHTCVMKRDGIVGVSLKQQLEGPHDTYEVNLDPNARFSHTYTGYYAKDTIKSVKLKFSYKIFNGKDGSGEIDIRTFDTDKKSSISLEVKGSLTSGHMSGKAGTYIKFIMPTDRYKILEFIRKNEVEDIKGYLNNIKYVFTEDDLKVIFEKDLESPKNGQSNSRMQAIIFTDWLESLDDKSKSKIVSDIVRFAKSESSWSAAHLLSK